MVRGVSAKTIRSTLYLIYQTYGVPLSALACPINQQRELYLEIDPEHCNWQEGGPNLPVSDILRWAYKKTVNAKGTAELTRKAGQDWSPLAELVYISKAHDTFRFGGSPLWLNGTFLTMFKRGRDMTLSAADLYRIISTGNSEFELEMCLHRWLWQSGNNRLFYKAGCKK